MKRNWLALLATLALLPAACGGGATTPTASSANPPAPGATDAPAATSAAPVELTMWMGLTPPPPESEAFAYLSLKSLIDEYTKLHPNVQVTMEYVDSDLALEKMTVALQGDKQPDISYQYGSNMPQIAQAPKVVDLTERVKEPAFGWEDFFPGERIAATVDGRVLGVPALVDNLAVVYNKDLFKAAGVPEPGPDWTWDDLRAAAKAISKPAEKVFGMAFPATASETMVWQNVALLWAAGGDILSPDNKKAVFNSPEGVRAVTILQQMQQDGSLLLDFQLDEGATEQLFNSDKIGMLITGPWGLASFPDANYGVQVMPSFDKGGSHQTIAGPDNWVMFDNGPDRVSAAWDLMKWITSKESVLKDSLATGTLPTRMSVQAMPEFAQFDQKYPGVGKFAENMANVLKARPQIAAYPQISTFYGQAIVNVLIGKAQPQEALDAAAAQSDGVLAAP